MSVEITSPYAIPIFTSVLAICLGYLSWSVARKLQGPLKDLIRDWKYPNKVESVGEYFEQIESIADEAGTYVSAKIGTTHYSTDRNSEWEYRVYTSGMGWEEFEDPDQALRCLADHLEVDIDV